MKKKSVDTLNLFKKLGAFLEDGHYVYSCGKHGKEYINKDALYAHPPEISKLARTLANQFANKHIDTVIGPATGGIILAQWVAYHLGTMSDWDVLAVYAEKKGKDGFELKRDYDRIVSAGRVLVVEDIITTGNSAAKVIKLVRSLGGKVVGCGALWNRSDGVRAKNLDVPVFRSLVEHPLEMYAPKDCPLCEKDIPLSTNVGKGREVARKSSPKKK